jgi:hypothetical protein
MLQQAPRQNAGQPDHAKTETAGANQSTFISIGGSQDAATKRLTENELGDFSRLWHDGCGVAIIEAQDVDRNHSPQV